MANIRRYLNTGTSGQSARIMRMWQLYPARFLRDCFDFTPDIWQEEVIELYKTHQRILMLCAKGPGKTALLSLLGLHFFLTNKLPKIGCLSETKDNLLSNLWPEILLWRSRSKLAIHSTEAGSTRIHLKGFESLSFIQARSYKVGADAETQATALSGFHADCVAFLIDEAGKIPDPVIETADAALSGVEEKGKKARLLVTSNTTNPSGLVYKVYQGNTVQKWAVKCVTGDPDDPNRSKRISKSWAAEIIQQYGRDHPRTRVDVLAQFPLRGSTQLLSERDIEASWNRTLHKGDNKVFEVKMGVDVARGGVDSSVIAIRKGREVLPLLPFSSEMDSSELAAQVMMQAKRHSVKVTYVDDTGGYGSGVVDALKFQNQFRVVAVNYATKARDAKHYFNRRSEMYIKMRDWVLAGGILPKDIRLKDDLLCPEVDFNHGIFRIESKEKIKKRLGRSPDRSDSLAQTFYEDDELLPEYQDKLGGDTPKYYSGMEDVDGRHNPMYSAY